MAEPRFVAFEPSSDDDELLEIFAANLVLRRKLGDFGDGAERGGVAASGVEDGVLDGRQREVRVSSGRRMRTV